jgi:glutathione S-transferase
MLQLYYYPGNASMCVHMSLRELAVPFELVLVDRATNAQRAREYLRLNPNGTIPVLVDGTLVLHETAAILLHLADTHPAARLAPALGTPERALFYKWLFWLSNTLQATIMVHAYPERQIEVADEGLIAQVRRQAQRRIGDQLELLEAQLRANDGPWLLGDTFSVLDPFAFMLCRWTRNFDASIATPARARPALEPYLNRMLQRPSAQQVFADERLPAPFF